jgi:hypothetical protein
LPFSLSVNEAVLNWWSLGSNAIRCESFEGGPGEWYTV